MFSKKTYGLSPENPRLWDENDMIAIIDYDAGNLKSVYKALQFLGKEACVTRDAKEILRADKVILPGVGSFGDAMGRLNEYDLVPVIREVTAQKKPFLGICLGLQLLFERSEDCLLYTSPSPRD